MEYRKEIDGLRALAVLPVILFHAGLETFSGGFIGVDVFFVISGYLITTIILSEMNKGEFSIARFYERRARRILPALFFVILACFAVGWFWFIPSYLNELCKSMLAVAGFSSNFYFWKTSGYFDLASELRPLLHTWSLSVEEQFYMLFPLLLTLVWKVKKRLIFALLLFIAIVSLVLAQYGAYIYPTASFYLLHTRAWELMVGALIAFYFVYKKNHAAFITSHKIINEFFSLIGLFLICYSIFAFNKSTPFPGFYALIPNIGTALIIIFATKGTAVGKFLSTKIMVGIGLISYSAYLWHQPLFAFAKYRSLDELSNEILIILSILSLLLGYFSWRFIELPFRDKKIIGRNKIFRMAVASSMLIAMIGYGVSYLGDGFPNRFDPLILKLLYPADGNKNVDNSTNKKADNSTTGNKPIKYNTVLIGDSHAGRLANALNESADRDGKSIKICATGGIVPLLGVRRAGNDAKAVLAASFISNILNDNNVDTVIIAAFWPYIYEGRRLSKVGSTVSFLVDENSTAKNTEESKVIFERGLKRTVEVFLKKGIKVILVGDVPEYVVNVPEYLGKNYYFNKKTNLKLPDKYIVTKEKYYKRNEEMDRIGKELKPYDRFFYVDTFNVMCPNSVCRYIDDNQKPLYNDTDHLSYEGSKILVNEIVKHW